MQDQGEAGLAFFELELLIVCMRLCLQHTDNNTDINFNLAVNRILH